MILRLLQRLEKSPHALFEERELREWDNAAFDRLRREGLLERASASDILWQPSGHPLLVVEDEDGVLEAIDEDDDEADPVAVAHEDLARWRLSMETLVERLRMENGLAGPSGRLHDRLYLVGQLSADSAAVLALLNDDSSGLPLLRSIATLASGSLVRFLVICPGFVLAAAHARSLEEFGIRVEPMNTTNPLTFPTSPAFLPEPRETTRETKAWADFEHSPDYRWIRIKDGDYELTSRQAQVIELLHSTGTPLGDAYIMEQLELGDRRLRDVFKGSPLWQTFIVGNDKGLFRLEP